MKDFNWYDSTLIIFLLVFAVVAGLMALVVQLSTIDVNAPPPQVCVQGVMYFEETLTPVYDVNSLNPTKCKD